MKHTWQITAILLTMFLATQLIGLAVVHTYLIGPELPYGMEPPEVKPVEGFSSIIFAFVIAVLLMFLLMKFNFKTVLRVWFFVVVILAIGITINSLLFYFGLPYASLIAALIALPLAFFKIFKRNLLVHNITELMIYPGIAAVFVILFSSWGSLGIWFIIILLILISAYDIYAVWHSGFMQKMAKFQINQLKFFAGFFVPYLGKKERKKVKALRQKYKEKQIPQKVLKKKKIQVSLAILGGGDVIFPIIAAGIFFKVFGLISALFITAGATLALLALFATARKGKFYPAMPFLTAGIFIGMLLSWLIF